MKKLLTLLLAVLLLAGCAGNKPGTFEAGKNTFLLNGKPFVVKAAEVHYPRIPREYWEHRIEMCKALGMNTLCLYVFWNLHEETPGKYDFTGNKDIAAFCKLAQKHGMYVIVRPGPYVCAEWEMGGLPWWLLKNDSVQLRTLDPFYMQHVGAFMHEVGKQLQDLQITRGGNTRKKSVPIIALPTTAGTAAEVTINYVITDEENHKKMVCVDPNDIPAIAIVDAELMYTLPKGLTASTGLDALTHAIEGLITKGAWEMSDMFEIKAIEMIARYLETAVFEPTNAEARNGMAVAQYIAGMAFSNVGLGVVHGMAHPLGAIFDIPHGVANALLLPVIMEFNAPAALSKYVDIAKAMNVYKDGMSREEAAKAAVEAVKALSVKVGIPQHLSELGIKEEDLPRLAASAIADVCTPGNPREVTEEIILELYKKAF